MRFLIFLLLAFLILSQAKSETTSSVEMEKAIKDTQAILENPNSRKKAMGENAATMKADAQVKALGGTESQNQQVYELAGDVFGSLARDSKGDPDKMDQVLEKALTDPEGFANRFTPEQRRKLHDLSIQIEGKKPLP